MSPRILFVSEFPAGHGHGPRYRSANTLAGLRQVGDVSIAYLPFDEPPTPWPASNEVPTFPAQVSSGWTAGVDDWIRWLRSPLPTAGAYENESELRRQLRPIVQRNWDLVWTFRIRPQRLLAPALDPATPTIVDLDDLNDRFIDAELAAMGPPIGRRRSRIWLRHQLDRRRWRRVQEAVADEVARVVVVTDDDVRHLGVSNAVAITNGYPDRPVVSHRRSSAPVMVFIGGFFYRPNEDAARFLATEVLPLVKETEPEATLALVGAAGGGVERLAAEIRGVDYRGFVDDLDGCFAEATAIMTPLRFGAGSRVKVAEAMATGVPLVTTGFGAAGYDLEPGRHALFAESARETADAVVRLHRTPELRERVVVEAKTHYLARFESGKVQSAVAQLAREVIGN